jgi:cytochrome c553
MRIARDPCVEKMYAVEFALQLGILANPTKMPISTKTKIGIKHQPFMRTVRYLFLFLMSVCFPTGWLLGAQPSKIDFARDVRPILQQCIKCHGAEKQQGGLRFDISIGALREGDTGSVAILKSNAAQSELIRRVESSDASERMPPEGESLSREQIKTLRSWIDQGADWPETTDAVSMQRREMVVTDEDRHHWSFRPLTAVGVPPVTNENWCETTIDRFILSKLKEKGLHPNSLATKRTLIRRIYFDLIGLPPWPAEVEAFENDSSDSAYERLVDKLLDSNHYGERWGRHWLDLTRYADSSGLETDSDRPNAYHYRDFVIRAFNDDMSYQTFARWQLAGDEYEPDNPQAIAATGLLTTAPNEMLEPRFIEEERLRLRFNELDDTAVTTASAFLGLTLGCARCHDHKFDAIPTRDYYRIQAAFMGTARGVVYLASREAIAKYQDDELRWSARIKPLQKQLDDWLAEQKKPLAEGLRHAKIDTLAISEADKQVLKDQPESEQSKRLAKSHSKKLEIRTEELRAAFTQQQREKWDELKQSVEHVNRTRPTPPAKALAITESSREPQPTWLLSRGDFYAKQEPVQLGFLSVLTRSRAPEDYLTAAKQQLPDAPSSLQRRALAEWMTDEVSGSGSLLARVIVNRIWQHHFGEGLSRTTTDFGVRAEAPSHPELLDWLSRDFVDGGWRLKRLHKQILMSAVYRQSTSFDSGRAAIDPDNRLLWRRRPRRLEAEAIRDAMLAVSGTLNTEAYGPTFKPPIPQEAMLARNTKSPYPSDALDGPATRRRSIYMFHKRVVQYPLMQVFDAPDASTSCGRRSNTIVAPQALALLNDPFIRARSLDFANRLMDPAGPDLADCIVKGFQLAIGRDPSDKELSTSLSFLESQIAHRLKQNASLSEDQHRAAALADFCQGLFSLNEFIYVD